MSMQVGDSSFNRSNWNTSDIANKQGAEPKTETWQAYKPNNILYRFGSGQIGEDVYTVSTNFNYNPGISRPEEAEQLLKMEHVPLGTIIYCGANENTKEFYASIKTGSGVVHQRFSLPLDQKFYELEKKMEAQYGKQLPLAILTSNGKVNTSIRTTWEDMQKNPHLKDGPYKPSSTVFPKNTLVFHSNRMNPCIFDVFLTATNHTAVYQAVIRDDGKIQLHGGNMYGEMVSDKIEGPFENIAELENFFKASYGNLEPWRDKSPGEEKLEELRQSKYFRRDVQDNNTAAQILVQNVFPPGTMIFRPSRSNLNAVAVEIKMKNAQEILTLGSFLVTTDEKGKLNTEAFGEKLSFDSVKDFEQHFERYHGKQLTPSEVEVAHHKMMALKKSSYFDERVPNNGGAVQILAHDRFLPGTMIFRSSQSNPNAVAVEIKRTMKDAQGNFNVSSFLVTTDENGKISTVVMGKKISFNSVRELEQYFESFHGKQPSPREVEGRSS